MEGKTHFLQPNKYSIHFWCSKCNSFKYQKADDKIFFCKISIFCYPNHIIFRIQRLEGKQCRYRRGGSIWATSSRSTLRVPTAFSNWWYIWSYSLFLYPQCITAYRGPHYFWGYKPNLGDKKPSAEGKWECWHCSQNYVFLSFVLTELIFSPNFY